MQIICWLKTNLVLELMIRRYINYFCEAFEEYEETRAVFLDISKAFDKVWHEGFIFKLNYNGISGILLKFYDNYLSNRHQRVVLNRKESNWMSSKAGVPPRVLYWSPCFFLYILMT